MRQLVVRDLDSVFDTVGGDTFTRSLRTLRRGGALVTAVAFPSDDGARAGVRIQRVVCKSDGRELALIRERIEAGSLAPNVSSLLPLSEVRRALRCPKAAVSPARLFCASSRRRPERLVAASSLTAWRG